MPKFSSTAVLHEINRRTSSEVRRLALNIVSELHERTPVDLGWARANWTPSVGAPAHGSRESSGNPQSAALAQQIGLSQVARYDVSKGNVWISNRVPYIERLDSGYSPQAPSGFVEMAIEAAIAE